MKGKIKSLFIIPVLILILPLTVFASGRHVNDGAGIMTTDQIWQLETLAEDFSDQYDMDFVVLTVESLGSHSSKTYADDYYDDRGYADDGMILMIAMQEREWYIGTCGYAVDAFPDRAIESLLDVPMSYFSQGDYYEGFYQVLLSVPHFIDAYSKVGSIDAPFRSVISIMFVSVVIGVVSAAVVLLIMRSSMNTKRKQRSAADYMKEGSYRLTIRQDIFLYSRISKTPRQQSSSGGSSSHRSSSGRIHGGGGRKF